MKMTYVLTDIKRLIDNDLSKFGQRVKSIAYSVYTYNGSVDIAGNDHDYSEKRINGITVETESIED
ncbi:hypothetical protein FO510_05310 [Bacillus pumilus]|uniref:hypothetical protein n=1 Tax=Bacillus TaxID=1386 RepID=UPI0006814744|nr:hypothetical protein [Bacillus pumilus]MCR4352217.1 hypothetical protein [Bacillus pumilus]MCY7504028.1 hypothetical protein [Bacillus pumilus]MDR4268982.1 hypothetical protein [Bacillus pumilus]MDR4269069.1 hypothetical protein [Bacillus pumilus]MED4724313.1 hypothetical protein [Bacillus pumilus]